LGVGSWEADNCFPERGLQAVTRQTSFLGPRRLAPKQLSRDHNQGVFEGNFIRVNSSAPVKPTPVTLTLYSSASLMGLGFRTKP
jgi:hypothetical protein